MTQFLNRIDECIEESGYMNTPWDLKFFYKWMDESPMLL